MTNRFSNFWFYPEEFDSTWKITSFGISTEQKVTDEGLTICFKVPGFKRDEIEIKTTEEEILVSGEIKEERDFAPASFIYPFKNTKNLTWDFMSAEAQMQDGLLIIHVKTKASKKAKTVKIK